MTYECNDRSKNRSRSTRPPIDSEVSVQEDSNVISIRRNIRDTPSIAIIDTTVSTERGVAGARVGGVRRVVVFEIVPHSLFLPFRHSIDVGKAARRGEGPAPGLTSRIVGRGFGLEDGVAGVDFCGAYCCYVWAAFGVSLGWYVRGRGQLLHGELRVKDGGVGA
jgi:hypothetical protein